MPIPTRVTASLVGLAATAAIAAAALAQIPPVGGAWETLAPMPDRRTEISAASDGGRLYVLVGFARDDGATTAPLEVYVFDPAAGAWSTLTSLPVGVNHAGLAYVDGALYVVGGYRETTFQATDRVMIYDIAADQWREGRPLPTARGALAVAVIDGRIHAIGGSGARGAGTAHEIYDPLQDQWFDAPDMPAPREHIAAAAVGTDIVVLGGRNGQTSTMTTNEIYDAATGVWRQGAAFRPAAAALPPFLSAGTFISSAVNSSTGATAPSTRPNGTILRPIRGRGFPTCRPHATALAPR